MDKQAAPSWAGDALQQCVDKYRWVAKEVGGGIPYMVGPDGRYDDRSAPDKNMSDGLSWWTNGMWAGLLWHLYMLTGETRFAAQAQTVEERLDLCLEEFESLHHDVGFMWIPSSVESYRITRSAASKRRAMHAATILAGRFHLKGNYIRAWNEVWFPGANPAGIAIIDCMMNLPLLYWASEQSGDPRFAQIAMAHSDTVIKTFLREDGSAAHIVEYDPETGAFMRTLEGQGCHAQSAWSRGQAWALYGFAVGYRMTKQEAYRKAAQRVAEYWIAHLPAGSHVPVDFCQSALPALEDSSAAAIAACGLLVLEEQYEGTRGMRYRKAACDILHTLYTTRVDDTHATQGLLTHCTGAYHMPGTHHVQLMYADYFYLEALCKLNGMRDFLW